MLCIYTDRIAFTQTRTHTHTETSSQLYGRAIQPNRMVGVGDCALFEMMIHTLRMCVRKNFIIAQKKICLNENAYVLVHSYSVRQILCVLLFDFSFYLSCSSIHDICLFLSMKFSLQSKKMSISCRVFELKFNAMNQCATAIKSTAES